MYIVNSLCKGYIPVYKYYFILQEIAKKIKLSLNHHLKLDPKFAKSIKKTESVLSITCFYGLKTYIYTVLFSQCSR